MNAQSRIEEWAWDQDVPFAAKIVLVCLSRYAHWGNLECWPSQATLAGQCSMSERAVRTQLASLEKEGLITRTKRLTPQGRQTDMTVLIIQGWGQPANPVEPTGKSGRNQPASPSGEPLRRTSQIEHTRERACSLFDEEDQPQAESPSSADDFLVFWQTYPRKVGRGAAEKAFRRAKTPGIAALKAAIGRQAKSKQWQEGFVPNPATWLNQKRWEDELDGARREVWD